MRSFSRRRGAAAARFTASALLMSVSTTALAQTAPADEESGDKQIQSAQEIVVQGEIAFHFRSEDTVPTLVYDSDYFQRFEPLTAGDALKRVPSVTFLSDVIESDGARIRGLPPGYTQILINGEKVPGSNADRSFFVDRIPAELISRVEIVRSNSARRTGDAVAGTINIIMRDGYQLDGGYVRAGGLLFDDGKLKPSFGAVFGLPVGPGRLLIGGNLQGRYNPKQKSSLRYSDSPENDPAFATNAFANREDQIDTRNGTDYSGNFSYEIDGETTDIKLDAFYVKTDRIEDERSREYNNLTATSGSVRGTPAGALLTDNANVADIKQDSFSLGGRIKQEWSLGETTLKIGYARFAEDRYETEYEIDFNRATPRFTGDLTQSDVTDSEVSAKLEHALPLADEIDFIVGGFWQKKSRDTQISEDRNRFNLTTAFHAWNQFSSNPTTAATPFDPALPPPGGFNSLDEKRLDGFVAIEGKSGALGFEAGVRYETTDLTIDDFTVPAAQQRQTNDYDNWLPSVAIRYDLSPRDRITASVARTNRRPDFNFLSPATLEAELGDNDLVGNPLLKPESAWGADLGFERKLGNRGVIGFNLFYRDVKSLIEVANTGVEGSEGPGTFVLQPRNTGNGEVWGAEFDLSTDLGFIGLRNTGVFGNVSYLDSSIADDFGKRRFNGQSKYVYNFGFIQDLPTAGIAFGATYRKQGEAFDRIVGEEIFTSYGADLEVFVEKRLGKNITIRAVGSNLLNASKDELFNKFTTIGDQTTRSFDEYELETEEAGPVFQLMARVAF